MSKDILSEYGPETHKPMSSRASNGGVMPVRDVRNYQPPHGPSNINDAKSPGLHGHNCGNAGTQGSYGHSDRETSGSSGLHGTNKGNQGTQNRR